MTDGSSTGTPAIDSPGRPPRRSAPVELRVDSDAGTRLDAYLAARIPELSRSRIQELIREQYILRNGQPAKPRDSVAVGDSLSVAIPEAVPAEAQPQDIPLHILFEDDHLVVLDKESGIVVHPAAGNPDGTLVNALLHHCKGRLSGIGGVERPGIVHRLDKDTSGCMVVAKTDVAHQSLTEQFSGRTMEKLYLAVAQGIPNPPKGTVFTHIGRHPVNRQKMAVVNPPGGKTAITDYEVLSIDRSTGSSLVLCHLHTGRTHQIRVHLLHLGCPLIGDPIYAKPERQKAKPGRLMLHAWRLQFDHPVTKERLKFEAAIPPEYTPWLQMLDHPLP
jgi:23S rRNA pseudouridine1911/1915/1917 synthase